MGIPVIRICLESSNTKVEKDPVQYNLSLEVDIKDIWEEMIVNANNFTKIKVYTTVSIPVIKNNVPQDVNFSIIDCLPMSSIVDQKIIQHAYFEGVYDESRSPICSVNIWKYEMVPYVEGG